MEEKKLSLHDRILLNHLFNQSLPLSEFAETAEDKKPLEDKEENNLEWIKATELEIKAVDKAEQKEYKVALELLNEATKMASEKASLFNNRAQVHQFMANFDEALKDLDEAIKLSGHTQKKTLSQALCQRGLLHRRNNNVELARADFNQAAELGSKFAKKQLVEINPYAALCNQMLRQVMEELN